MIPAVIDGLDRMLLSAGRERRTILARLPRDEAALDELRRIRREGPGRLRPAALEALVYLGGEAALEASDVAAAERLIGIRQRVDVPSSLAACWSCWFCVAGGDQHGIMALLGLTHPRPTTYVLAQHVIDNAAHGCGAGLVCVTAEINGWTAVVGPWCDIIDAATGEQARRHVMALSAEYGEAHGFCFGPRGDESAWLVARDGVAVRHFSELTPSASTGLPLPIEQRYLDRFGIPGRPEEHFDSDDEELIEALWDFRLECTAQVVARDISLDVVWSMPADGVVRGHSVLAATPGSGRQPIPAGSLRI